LMRLNRRGRKVTWTTPKSKTLAWCWLGRKCPTMGLPAVTKPRSAIENGLKINSSSSCPKLLHR
jgi:hypothetical protein